MSKDKFLFALSASFALLAMMAQGLAAQSCSCCSTDCTTYPYFEGDMSGDAGSSGTPADLPTFNVDEQFASFGGSTFASQGGYIDNAIPMDQVRFRFDAAYDNPFPDRAEFFYAQCGCNGGGADGPPLPEASVDYQEFNIYFEKTLTRNLSAFIDTPIRFINPINNANTGGFSDLQAGVKYALINCPDEVLSFQLRVYTPTGDANAGLGTAHTSIEPGILYFRRLSSKTTFEAELRDWIPVGGSSLNGRPYAGNILRYGAGLSYALMQDSQSCCNPRRLTAVGEIVGWSILGGQALNIAGPNVFDVDGQTIINGKLGMRYSVGKHSVYVGYGRALSGDVFYKDIVRAEYRLAF